MKLLLIGGAGLVGTVTTPYLRARHEIRVLDPFPPKHDSVEYIPGSSIDHRAVTQAIEGVDSFIYMVLKHPLGDGPEEFNAITGQHEANVMGLHILLEAAKREGIERGVYTSTFTVHDRSRKWYAGEDKTPLDNTTVYGFTKGLGERVCEYYCRAEGMAITALRITSPAAREHFLERRSAEFDGRRWTDEEDLALAYQAALEAEHPGFEAVFIAGDERQEEVDLSKARELLGWEPLSYRLAGEEDGQSPN